jgi:hypothetical protein
VKPVGDTVALRMMIEQVIVPALLDRLLAHRTGVDVSPPERTSSTRVESTSPA